jgi:hypothetical protein
MIVGALTRRQTQRWGLRKEHKMNQSKYSIQQFPEPTQARMRKEIDHVES